MKRILACFLALFLLAGCSPAAPGSDGSSAPADQSIVMPEPEPQPPTVSHLMVAGDVMSHMPITNDAYVAKTGEYDYTHMMEEPGQQLTHADYSIANLETVLNGGPKYSGFPAFNSPDGLAFSVSRIGFDMLATANNHSRDRGVDGIYRTLDVLDEAGLAHVGTYRSQAERDAHSGVYMADVGGIKVAFLSYTYGLNGYRLNEENMYAVNLFNTDYYTTICTPDYDLMKSDLAAAKAMDPDVIAVVMHWGVEYQNKPNEHQTKLADFLVENGADLVLGGHPHVLQPYDTITVTGADGQEHTGFVIYSLGNFISNQQELETKTTAILDLELTKDNNTGDTELTDVRYTPYYMLHNSDKKPAGQRRFLINTHAAMEEYESGDHSRISSKVYEQLKLSLAHAHKILGEEGDKPSEG